MFIIHIYECIYNTLYMYVQGTISYECSEVDINSDKNIQLFVQDSYIIYNFIMYFQHTKTFSFSQFYKYVCMFLQTSVEL